MGFAAAQRAACCDDLLRAGPDAPTLCEGWTAADLVAHLWVRENDPVAAPGIVIGRLADLTQRRMDAALERWSFAGLVDLVRQGPPKGSAFALPGVDERANVAEYFIHGEDVRRPNQLPALPHDPAFEDWAWGRVSSMARFFFRTAASGVTLERADGASPGPRVVAHPGATMVTVLGDPSELLMFAFGRVKDARVRYVGLDADVAALTGTHIGF